MCIRDSVCVLGSRGHPAGWTIQPSNHPVARARARGRAKASWMDGWMVGWLDGWMVGWLDVWM
eukprot:10055142-Alexandrium_andersonii.AAC.1